MMEPTWYERLFESGVPKDEIFKTFIRAAPGAFNVFQLTKNTELQLDILEYCEKLVLANRLNRYGSRRGWYKGVDKNLIEMDFINANDKPVDIILPFGLHKKVNIYPGNIIVFAGAPNSGKTTLNLNVIRDNMNRHKCHYFNSEMPDCELKMRLNKFDYLDVDQWKFKAYRRAGDFHDVIFPGEGNLNIIDFLEVHDEFYMIGQWLKLIHDRLDGAIAIVSIQKNPGADVGLGGYRTIEVARLALSLDFGKAKITKGKNYDDNISDPNGMICNFKIRRGAEIIQTSAWHTEHGR